MREDWAGVDEQAAGFPVYQFLHHSWLTVHRSPASY